jgi:hypothetical protein
MVGNVRFNESLLKDIAFGTLLLVSKIPFGRSLEKKLTALARSNGLLRRFSGDYNMLITRYKRRYIAKLTCAQHFCDRSENGRGCVFADVGESRETILAKVLS